MSISDDYIAIRDYEFDISVTAAPAKSRVFLGFVSGFSNSRPAHPITPTGNRGLSTFLAVELTIFDRGHAERDSAASERRFKLPASDATEN